MVDEEEEEEEEYSSKYYAEETNPIQLPYWLRLFLRLNSWLVIRSDGYPRRRMQKLTDVRLRPLETTVLSSYDTVINPSTGLWIRIYAPSPPPAAASAATNAATFPVFFYFHGGGFTMFSADSPFPDLFCRYLSLTFSAIVISVDYRKTPSVRFPAPYDDCFAALTWADQNPPPSADLSRCFLIGESAGGNLAHHISLRAATSRPSLLHVRVIGVAALFPFFGSEKRTAAELRLEGVAPMLNYRMCDAAWKDLLPEGATRDHPASNPAVARPASSEEALPPILVAIGEYDCLKEHQVRFARGCRRSGQKVDFRYYEGGVHCFHVFPNLRLTERFRCDLRQFVESCLSSSSSSSSS